MLALTRKKGESLVVNNNVEITVLEVRGDQVKIGIKAPKGFFNSLPVYLFGKKSLRNLIRTPALERRLFRSESPGVAQTVHKTLSCQLLSHPVCNSPYAVPFLLLHERTKAE